jgi:hypothetical protein
MNATSTMLATARLGRQLADTLTITDSDGDLHRCTLGDFLAANFECSDLVAEVLALEPGQSTWGGGGASPWFSIQRDPRNP